MCLSGRPPRAFVKYMFHSPGVSVSYSKPDFTGRLRVFGVKHAYFGQTRKKVPGFLDQIRKLLVRWQYRCMRIILFVLSKTTFSPLEIRELCVNLPLKSFFFLFQIKKVPVNVSLRNTHACA